MITVLPVLKVWKRGTSLNGRLKYHVSYVQRKILNDLKANYSAWNSYMYGIPLTFQNTHERHPVYSTAAPSFQPFAHFSTVSSVPTFGIHTPLSKANNASFPDIRLLEYYTYF